ncbi:MAG: hypothetical protein WAV32_08860 [Halobacteriota archaeon]
MSYPDWVLKHKRKGTEIRKKGNNFYLYKVTGVWDKEKKRARKITEKFLGTITQDGLIKTRKERLMESIGSVIMKAAYEKGYMEEIDWLLSEGLVAETLPDMVGKDAAKRSVKYKIPYHSFEPILSIARVPSRAMVSSTTLFSGVRICSGLSK